MQKNLKEFLDAKVDEYNQPSFIKDDPVSIPHRFTKKQDIEIAGFFTAIFSWGNRTTIINKSKDLLKRMDMAPYDFIRSSTKKDLKRLNGFKHRTFHEDDLFYFIEFFRRHYEKFNSLENAFLPPLLPIDIGTERGSGPDCRPIKGEVEHALNHFKKYFFSFEHQKRTEKHIASPLQKSTCKRLNMFLRWMVRNDNRGVDFGIWKSITPAALICPLDVHVARVARKLKLLHRKQNDWQAAIELTKALRNLDKQDPVKYDFALFKLGIDGKF